MKMKSLFLALALIAFTGTAHAATIEYIFQGTGTGTYSGTPGTTGFNSDFTVTLFGDTSAVFAGINRFDNSVTGNITFGGALTGVLSAPVSVAVITSGTPTIGFIQTQPSPVFAVAEATSNSAFGTYDLSTALALTAGNPSFANQTFLTTDGFINFSSISSLSFEAELVQTPLPAAMPMFIAALASLAAFGLMRRKETV
ncbi:MAG TPA: hypothetical protein VFR09_03445 [Alphaproteobacteria bacterium]|nr:hypothetical protein [Alphaproteobacteria bacterium]